MERLILRRIEIRSHWADVGGPASVTTQLRQLAEGARRHLAGAGTGGIGVFTGEHEADRSKAVEALASELGWPLYRIDLGAVASPCIDETEKNIDRLFAAIGEGGAILLLDEAGALFGKRSAVKDSHDRYANIEASYLLQRLETFKGLAILAVASDTELDAAVLRRLRFRVTFPRPPATTRLGGKR